MLALLEAFLGYSLVDDLMSGMGLLIGYSVGMSIPFVGANLMTSSAVPWPGMDASGRASTSHTCLLFPVLIGVLLSVHLALVALAHHTQFRSAAADRAAVVGVPPWPGQTPRSLGLLAVAGVLFLLGGLVQINPIWLWGPYHTYAGDERRAARLVSRLADRRAAADAGVRRRRSATTRWSRTRSGAGRLPAARLRLPLLLALGRAPVHARHGVSQPRRPAARRAGATAIGVAVVTWVFLVFVAGASDRVDVLFGLSYVGQLWAYRVTRLRSGPGRGRAPSPIAPAGAAGRRACRGRPAARGGRGAA